MAPLIENHVDWQGAGLGIVRSRRAGCASLPKEGFSLLPFARSKGCVFFWSTFLTNLHHISAKFRLGLVKDNPTYMCPDHMEKLDEVPLAILIGLTVMLVQMEILGSSLSLTPRRNGALLLS